MSSKNDRWSALSMKERADLINMYITNGISELKEMKRHYNSFDTGGDTDGDENTVVNDLSNTNTPTINKGYTQHNDLSLTDLETFNKNWYDKRDNLLVWPSLKEEYEKEQNRQGQENTEFYQRAYDAGIDPILSKGIVFFGDGEYMIDGFSPSDYLKFRGIGTASSLTSSKPDISELLTDYYTKTKDPNIKPFIEKTKQFINDRIDTVQEIVDPETNYESGANGYYNRDTHVIGYASQDRVNSSTKVHERDHPINMYDEYAAPVVRDEDIPEGANTFLPGYYDKPNEIKSRLMEMRYLNKIDPNHTYTPEEVEAMRNDPNFIDMEIFSRYTNDYILHLLNDVALNNKNKDRLDYVAPENIIAYGGKLNMFDEDGVLHAVDIK